MAGETSWSNWANKAKCTDNESLQGDGYLPVAKDLCNKSSDEDSLVEETNYIYSSPDDPSDVSGSSDDTSDEDTKTRMISGA